MDIAATDEQLLLRDTITRLLKDSYDFATRQQAKATPDGWSRELWSTVAREGFLGLLAPGEAGGFDGGPSDALIVMQALGEVLAVEPFLQTMVVAVPAVADWGSDEQRARYLEPLTTGETVSAFALAEGDGRDFGPDFGTRAKHAGDGWRLSGRKVLVHGGATADLFLVVAQTDDGPGLFLVPGGAAGVDREPLRMHDGTATADVIFDEAPGEPLGQVGSDAVGLSVARAVAGLVAEAVGVLNTAYDLTLDHLRTRHQFGKAIGVNQALQHRAAEMLVSLELCRSMALFAASAVTLEDHRLRAARLSQAKAVIGLHGWQVADAAVQLHGGMGMVEEYPVGICLKRLIAIDASFGNAAHHVAALGRSYDLSTL